MFKRSLFGVLGCEMRLAVASQPMRHSDAASGRSYLTCTPHRLEKSRLRSRRELCKICWVPGSQNTSRNVTSCVIRNRSCSTIASKDRSPVHSFDARLGVLKEWTGDPAFEADVLHER